MRKNPIEKSAEMRMTDFVEKEHNICELVKQMFNLFYFFFQNPYLLTFRKIPIKRVLFEYFYNKIPLLCV